MTEHVSVLQIFAQIFIALAGFAGIIATFSRFHLAQEVITFRVRFLVAVGLTGLISSLLPLLPPNFGATELTALRISAMVFAFLILLIGIASWRVISKIYDSGVLHTQAFSAFLYVAAIFIFVALSSVAAGWFSHYAWGVYLAGLFYGLILCSYYFLMMMLAANIGDGK